MMEGGFGLHLALLQTQANSPNLEDAKVQKGQPELTKPRVGRDVGGV